jgi:hypothetical protein
MHNRGLPPSGSESVIGCGTKTKQVPSNESRSFSVESPFTRSSAAGRLRLAIPAGKRTSPSRRTT